jgi:hypothetical protein
MRSFISSSDRKFIITLAVWSVIFSIAANGLVGYGLQRWPLLDRRVQMGKFDVAATLESYFRNYRQCPIVILGSSIAAGLPPEGWERSGVCTITLVGEGSFLGLEVMSRMPAAPQVLFVESNFGFRDAPAEQIARFTEPLPRAIRDWLPLTSAQGNWINILWRLQYPIERNLYRPSLPLPEWRAQRKRYADIYLQIYGGPVSEWSRNHLEENLKRTKELVAEFERRGTKVIFYETPLDPEVVTLPVIAFWSEKMHAEFAGHEWVTDSTDKYYLNDGMHFLSGSGKDFFDLLMAHVPGGSPQALYSESSPR